jgi:hypothetical protein
VIVGRAAGLTDTGRRRRQNEDAFVCDPPLFAIADGMGGAQAGELASRLAAAAIEEAGAAVADGEGVVGAVRAANARAMEAVGAAVLLPEGVACYAIAATTGKTAGHLTDKLVGDGIVPLASALGRHTDPRLALNFDEARQWVACGINHLDLLSRPEVYAQIKRWLAGPS